MDLASVVAAFASVGVRVSGSAPNSSVQVDSSRACPPGLAGPEPSGTIHDLGQHFQKVAPSASGGAPPTMAPPAYHPYQMPMVQNSYTKAVEDSDMPKPQFNGQLESYDEWVEKLQQWLGVCDPMYRKANEAKMILSTLPPWLKAIINARGC